MYTMFGDNNTAQNMVTEKLSNGNSVRQTCLHFHKSSYLFLQLMRYVVHRSDQRPPLFPPQRDTRSCAKHFAIPRVVVANFHAYVALEREHEHTTIGRQLPASVASELKALNAYCGLWRRRFGDGRRFIDHFDILHETNKIIQQLIKL